MTDTSGTSGTDRDGILGEPAMPTEPSAGPVDGVPADIAESVDTVANRYGAPGLRQLIDTAGERLRVAEASLRELAAEQ